MKSDVYFVPVSGSDLSKRCQALGHLLEETAAHLAYKKDEIVPVKVTIGDASCVCHMHPSLVKDVVTRVKKQGAKPFLFDTNVIYHGQRQNAVDHLNLVEAKGFSAAQVGAPFVVADGVLGQDGREHEVKGAHIRRAKVPSFVGYLDSLLVLSHATGHIFTGYAGAIKNVAMGMSCRATKQVQHSSVKPTVEEAKCTACGRCVRICPVQAISPGKNKRAVIDARACIGCGECLCACAFEAVVVNWDEDMDIFGERMVDVACFVLSQFKKKFFITFAFDITQECDCISTNKDPMIMRDFGILASDDPLALDQAVVEMAGDNKFLKAHAAYRHMFEYAQKVGLGSLEYRLVKIP